MFGEASNIHVSGLLNAFVNLLTCLRFPCDYECSRLKNSYSYTFYNHYLYFGVETLVALTEEKTPDANAIVALAPKLSRLMMYIYAYYST
jgi:hypothetical protein